MTYEEFERSQRARVNPHKASWDIERAELPPHVFTIWDSKKNAHVRVTWTEDGRIVEVDQGLLGA